MQKRIRDTDTRNIVEWAMKLGFTVEHSCKHGKLHLPALHKHIVFGYTPSDYRASANFRAHVKRFAREAGISV